MRYKEKQQCRDTDEMTALSFSRIKIPIAFSETEITENHNSRTKEGGHEGTLNVTEVILALSR